MILRATHTHLYPGHRGTLTGLERLADLRTETDCLVEFVDGSAAPARIWKSERGWRLDTGAYRTAAGTDIAARSWLLRLQENRGEVAFRILKPAPRE